MVKSNLDEIARVVVDLGERSVLGRAFSSGAGTSGEDAGAGGGEEGEGGGPTWCEAFRMQ